VVFLKLKAKTLKNISQRITINSANYSTGRKIIWKKRRCAGLTEGKPQGTKDQGAQGAYEAITWAKGAA